MNVVTLRQGRLASLKSFSKGCQALGNTAPEGPQDSVAILGVRDGMVRMIDCDGSDNLQLLVFDPIRDRSHVARSGDSR